MGGHDDAMPSSARRALVVVAGRESGDGAGQIVGELGPVSGRRETDLGVDGEGGQWLSRRVGEIGRAHV